MGPLDQIFGMIPGFSANAAKLQVDETQTVRHEAIILSMNPHERREPSIINGSRRWRIAAGSGTTVQDVNQLLNKFEEAKKMVRGLAGGEMPGMPGASGFGGKHSGSNKKNKRKHGSAFKFPFGR